MSTARKPTISAVVAAYQAQDWIGEALDAILGQSRAPDEVIVVDDGSTDGTARELARYDGRIRVIGQENRELPGGVQHRVCGGARRFRGNVRRR